MVKSTKKEPAADLAFRFGRGVSAYMHHARLSTVWVRETSHFGNSTLTSLKKASCIL